LDRSADPHLGPPNPAMPLCSLGQVFTLIRKCAVARPGDHCCLASSAVVARPCGGSLAVPLPSRDRRFRNNRILLDGNLPRLGSHWVSAIKITHLRIPDRMVGRRRNTRRLSGGGLRLGELRDDSAAGGLTYLRGTRIMGAKPAKG